MNNLLADIKDVKILYNKQKKYADKYYKLQNVEI